MGQSARGRARPAAGADDKGSEAYSGSGRQARRRRGRRGRGDGGDNRVIGVLRVRVMWGSGARARRR